MDKQSPKTAVVMCSVHMARPRPYVRAYEMVHSEGTAGGRRGVVCIKRTVP